MGFVYQSVIQLLSITHDIYQSFDNFFEVRGVFLEISKALDKVWHKGLIYKLKQSGVTGNLLNFLADFLKDRKQRVVLNGQIQHGSILKQEFLKVQFSDRYF